MSDAEKNQRDAVAIYAGIVTERMLREPGVRSVTWYMVQRAPLGGIVQVSVLLEKDSGERLRYATDVAVSILTRSRGAPEYEAEGAVRRFLKILSGAAVAAVVTRVRYD